MSGPVGVGARFGCSKGGDDFSPLSLAPLAWYRSDLVTESGGVVSAWPDQSGNGHHLTQADAGKRPAYSASDAAFGGKPSINFDETDDLLTSAATIVQPDTCDTFLVSTVPANASYIYELWDGTYRTEYLANTSIRHDRPNPGALSIKGIDLPLNADSGVKTYNHRLAGSHASHVLYVNDVLRATTTIVPHEPVNDSDPSALYLNNTNDLLGYSGVTVAELIFFGPLTTNERAQVMSYLQERYGHY